MPFDITQFGAVGDGDTSCTAAIQKAIDTAATRGGGTVVVPPGRYVTGSIRLASNINLHLEAGATLLGSHNLDEFPLGVSKWEGPRAVATRAALITGEGLDNVALTGRGTIDARGQFWWDLHKKHHDTPRPYIFRVIDSRNVLVEGVTLRNSPMWTCSPLACDNVTISGITIINPSDSPNTDGINPDSCSNVHISNCHIDVGDDCITIKSGKEDDGRANLRACENITVTNCTLVHGHGGVVIGSEISGSVRNVAITNCVFVGTDRGIRIKARRGRGGLVEDLRVSNLVMDGVLAPITINLFYGCGAWNDPKVLDRTAYPVDAGTPRFRRLRFSNITARRVQWAAVYVLGLPEMHVEDVSIDNVSLFLDPQATQGGPPVMAPGVDNHCRSGIIIRNARGVRLRNIDLHHHIGTDIAVATSSAVILDGLTLEPDGHDEAMIILDDISRAAIRDCRSEFAEHSAPVSVCIRGAATRDIRLDADAASLIASISPEVSPDEVTRVGSVGAEAVGA